MTKLDFLVAVRDRYACNESVWSVTATASLAALGHILLFCESSRL